MGRPCEVYPLMQTVPEHAAPTVPADGLPHHGLRTATGRATVAGAAVAVLVAGVVAAVDPAGLRPYTTLRWTVVGVATAVVAAAVPWRPARTVAVPGAALLAWVALATATAHDPLTALVGHSRRHFGLAGWFVCALALVAGTGLGGRLPHRRLGRTVAVAAALTGAATLADLAGWDPFGTRFAGGRVGGLLGQPLYLAVAALLVGPVAAGVAADRTERRAWRLVGAAGCAGAVLALAASQTRGAWLGGLVATVLLAGRHRSRWYRWCRWSVRGDVERGTAGRRTRGRGVATAVGAAAVLGVVLVAAGPRLADLADRDAAGGIGRVDEWRVAVRVVADHPITGVGPEGYRIAALARIDDDYTRRHGRDEVVDRAHSAPLDVAATAGVPAALLYVALAGVVVVRCARVVDRAPDPVRVGAAVGVLAWSVQQLVGFPIAEVDPLAWLLAGVVVAAPSARPAGRAGSDGGDAARERDATAAPGGRGGRLSWVPSVLAGAVAVVLGAGGLVGVVADRSLARSEDARARGDLGTALAEADRAVADRAVALHPDDVDAWYLAVRIAATPEGLPALDNGLDRVEEALSRLPDDPALRHLHTALLVERAQRSGLEADVASADASARALVADDPSSPGAHRALGLASAARGDPAAARAALARAVALDPDDAGARSALRALDEETSG